MLQIRLFIVLGLAPVVAAHAQFATHGGTPEPAPNIHLAHSNGSPLRLLHNKAAANPSFDRLIVFLQSDTTCELRYVDGEFTCVEFALTLHDNAERAGLRAGYVLVTFEKGDGHALTAFDTTDRGRVFVDPTGARELNNTRHFVALAYLEKGKPYGLLPLEVGQGNPTDYSYYLNILAEHNGLASWRHRIEAEAAELDAAAASLASRRAGLSTQAQANGYAGAVAALKGRQERLADESNRWKRSNDKVGVSLTLANLSPVKSVAILW